ncbi:olfactory receptor 1-like [Perca flavescens]|uniref:olfactory receptor 1-like n=1 Tax=Perca flavescens TaxID=8167 RepID=UPI00106EB4E2|nr:olfactory receptor 1-like [Perca flavescens]
MINSSYVSYFTLAAYFDTEMFKYVYFLLILSLYMLIACANLLLIVVICMNRSLHEPMYLFLCSLFVNELYGSTGLFPFLLVQILSDIHTVSAPFCFLQIFCLYTYGSVEFTNLAIMSYDRYLAICYPLQYHIHMTSNKVVVLIAVTWSLPFFAVFVTTLLSASLQLCGNIINKVYCDNYSIIKLACYETRVNNVYELIAVSVTVCVPITVIFYTYFKILKVCFSGSKQTRQKAVSTCTPHLASLLNFFLGSFFEILQSRFDMNSVPNVLRILLSLYFLTCQPIFNPVIYGLNMSKIRIMCQSLLSSSVLGGCCKHHLKDCPKLKTQPQVATVEFLKTKGFCLGCLLRGHMSKNCKRRMTCEKCQGKHPTILHLDKVKLTEPVKQKYTSINSGPVTLKAGGVTGRQRLCSVNCASVSKSQKRKQGCADLRHSGSRKFRDILYGETEKTVER